MGIFYDPNSPTSKKWQVTEEKTDYETKHQTVFELLPENLNEQLPTTTQKQVQKSRTAYKTVQKTETYRTTELQSVYDSKTMTYTNVWQPVTKTRTYSVQEPYTEYYYDWVPDVITNNLNYQTNETNAVLNAQNKKANQINEATKQSNIALNKKNEDLNIANTNKNNAYKTTVETASGTRAGE